MIASHNTMTYLEPTSWWMKLLKPIYKCQDLDIVQQYNLGVRHFDLRIKIIKDGFFCFAHGIVTFKGSIFQTLYELNKLGPCLIRIILEESKRSNNKFKEIYFRDIVGVLVRTHPNLMFYEGTRKYDWKELCNDLIFTKCNYIQRISSMTGIWYNFWCPRLYSWMNNKKIVNDIETDKNITFIDFIGKYY